MASAKICRMCNIRKEPYEFTNKSSEPDGKSRECRDCQRDYRIKMQQRKAQGAASSRHASGSGSISLTPPANVVAAMAGLAGTPPGPSQPDEIDEEIEERLSHIEDIEEVDDEPEELETIGAKDFIQMPEVLSTFVAVQKIAKNGGLAPNMLFKGPSGCGKTEAARDLAKRADLPFIKVDAPAMVDPEAWFGTREVVVEDGAPKTVYVPSAFAEGIEQACLMLIDEANRISDAVRQILLPLLDASRQVTNPLTGQVLKRHPQCFIIMTGNVGLAFTGTYAIDPAFMTRALVTNFEYLDAKRETQVVMARTACDRKAADALVRFANDTRQKAKVDEDFPPVSTREVLAAAELIGVGLDATTAVREAVINGASEEGGAESLRAQLEYLWKGIWTN